VDVLGVRRFRILAGVCGRSAAVRIVRPATRDRRKEASMPGLYGPWVACARCGREVAEASLGPSWDGPVCVRCQIDDHEERQAAREVNRGHG
jgi:hypothetical protein